MLLRSSCTTFLTLGIVIRDRAVPRQPPAPHHAVADIFPHHAHDPQRLSQSCPWVGLTHGLGWVEIFQFLVGWVGSTMAEV